jgi:hypothetical protein
MTPQAAERIHIVPRFLAEGYKRGIQWPKKLNKNALFSLVKAEVAQLVEQLIRNQQVTGSSPVFGSIFRQLEFERWAQQMAVPGEQNKRDAGE